jgi:hypothetical protein
MQYYSNTAPFVPHWFFSSSSEINWSTSSFWDLGISLVVGITWRIVAILPLTIVGFKTNTPTIPDQRHADKKSRKPPPKRCNFLVIIIRCQTPEQSRSMVLLITMDPSWSSIKRILRRHEDMTKRSRLNYAEVDGKVNQVGNKLNGHEQIILALLH